MKSHGIRRLAWPIVFLGAALSVACSDAATSSSGGPAGTRDDLSTVPPGVTAASVRARDNLHRRNKEDWVGIAHNKMLDDFRRDMRKPGLLTRNVCEYVSEFGMRDERLPNGRQFVGGANWRAVRAAAEASPLCSGMGSVRGSPIAFRRPAATLTASASQSSEVLSLTSEIETAVSNASDSYDLAIRLNPILDRAARLPALDQATIAATVSVALNSYEYWEGQYPIFQQEFFDEYSWCAEEKSALGLTDDIIRAECLTGKSGGAVTFRDVPREPAETRMVSIRAAFTCGTSPGPALKRIVRADIGGAVKGFLAGAAAGGLEGAVGGAIVGAGVASIWAGIEEAWALLKCIYGFAK